MQSSRKQGKNISCVCVWRKKKLSSIYTIKALIFKEHLLGELCMDCYQCIYVRAPIWGWSAFPINLSIYLCFTAPRAIASEMEFYLNSLSLTTLPPPPLLHDVYICEVAALSTAKSRFCLLYERLLYIFIIFQFLDIAKIISFV